MSALNKIDIRIKTGNEPLQFHNKPLNYSILDFWRWSVSDIISNAARGRFAEFIVALAMDVDISQVRDEWSAYDLDSPEGIKIEVKSAAYLQSWHQKKLSAINFSIKESKLWDSTKNEYDTVLKRHADVYVFCLLKHTDKQTINPLELEQWDFYVISAIVLNQQCKNRASISLTTLKQLTEAVDFSQINDAVKIAANKNPATW